MGVAEEGMEVQEEALLMLSMKVTQIKDMYLYISNILKLFDSNMFMTL